MAASVCVCVSLSVAAERMKSKDVGDFSSDKADKVSVSVRSNRQRSIFLSTKRLTKQIVTVCVDREDSVGDCATLSRLMTHL